MRDRVLGTISKWKWPSLLLLGIGISNIGDFIYLIAINLLVLDMTNSPIAVAGIYVIKPIASIFISPWSGSLIDRHNLKKIMISTDILRGIFIACIPFMFSIWYVYFCILLISMSSCFFAPTSNTYIARMIPEEERKQFNSFYTLISSGAFVTGPAIAGVLLLFYTYKIAIFINAISFFLSALVTCFLPNVNKESTSRSTSDIFSIHTIKKDWKMVFSYLKGARYVLLIYILFQVTMLIAFALDAQEAVYIRKDLSLSETNYGLLVSITGIGYLVGSIVNSFTNHRFSTKYLIGIGSLLVSTGYVVYSFSYSFNTVAVGFVILSFSMSFVNTGYLTFYQNNIPIDLMGRVGSILGMFQGMFLVACTMGVGLLGQFYPIKTINIIGSHFMILISVALMTAVLLPSKLRYFKEYSSVKKSS
ncbi:Predicted arabinose efflux permease, MFS family [Thermoactinomyces sp. DSM 45891]|uniref:MFS transporter n=1 Tax=Thermoactinomyces sp. DSM 45891 TaxID=1761907 RepID=UPI000924362B|nr:MFS transporter [Thermoactinomyces sp. DSM 45891]SFX75904.1 Predicted arabinose efflux permease, MFS family [Thermoactinomyces sp. DSM 45891]